MPENAAISLTPGATRVLQGALTLQKGNFP